MTPDEQEVKFAADLSRGFTDWLASKNVSLAITTYQVGKMIFFGLDEAGKFWVYNRNIGRCLGIAPDDTGFWIAGETQLHRFGNVFANKPAPPSGPDALYAPRFSYVTGDVDAHDVALDRDGRPVFVNTLFNCVARPSTQYSFEPIWTPPFISRLAAEDRCHLNGLAMVDGVPGFVTAVSDSDTFDGWRDQRRSGGLVMDMRSNEIVCTGLSMPHSPRWHAGKLWLHNSGTGEFGFVNFGTGTFEAVAFCPGYLRGLSFIGDVAVMGLSLPRDNKTFSGLQLDETLSTRKMAPRRGLYFVDTKSGDIVHSIVLDGVVTELYDVAVLPNVRQPTAISVDSEEVKRTIAVP